MTPGSAGKAPPISASAWLPAGAGAGQRIGVVFDQIIAQNFAGTFCLSQLGALRRRRDVLQVQFAPLRGTSDADVFGVVGGDVGGIRRTPLCHPYWGPTDRVERRIDLHRQVGATQTSRT